MTLLELQTYFENYAKIHVDLLHDPASTDTTRFFCMNTEKNTDEFIRNNPLDLIMILLVPDKVLNHSGGGKNYTFNKHVAYMVLKRVPGMENGEIIAAQNQCEKIVNDFATRIITDRAVLLDGYEDGSFTVHPVGPMGDNHYGYMGMLTLVDWFDQRVDPARWTV